MYVYLFKKWVICSFPLFLMSNVSESFRSLTKNEQCERIAQVAHQKKANEWITHFFERIAHSLIFSQKTSNSLRKPMSEFPALSITIVKFLINKSFYNLQYNNWRRKNNGNWPACSKFATRMSTIEITARWWLVLLQSSYIKFCHVWIAKYP